MWELWKYFAYLIVLGLASLYGVSHVKAQDLSSLTEFARPQKTPEPTGISVIDGTAYNEFTFPGDEDKRIFELEQALNVCWEEFVDHISWVHGPAPDYPLLSWHVLVPQNAPPCYNTHHQRLTYYSDNGQALDTPEYSTRRWTRLIGKTFEDMPYCRGDLLRANPSLNKAQYRYRSGMTVFVDETVRLCKTIPLYLYPPLPVRWPWIDGVALKENICFDDLIAANHPLFVDLDHMTRRFYMTADVPYNHPPCYDSYGRRLGYQDRSVYYPKRYEKLREVADKHSICLEDLLNANPHWATHKFTLRVPIVFIPDTTPCDLGQFYRTKGFETLTDISLVYNVCPEWIQSVTPDISDFKNDEVLPPQTQLKIPMKLPCWVTRSYQGADGPRSYEERISYVCYREPINFSKDYTGTEPPISFELNTFTSDYCYETGKRPILYENQFYDSLWATNYSFEGWYDIAACYHLDFEEFLDFNESSKMRQIRDGSTVFIPQGSQACDWREMNSQLGQINEQGIYTVKKGDTLSSLAVRFGYLMPLILEKNQLESPHMIYPYQKLQMPSDRELGNLNDQGIYRVTTGDTLGLIGWRYGYLPSMIAAENNLEAPYMIYPYQELRMPQMPSFYDIGKAVLYVLGVGAGLFAFGVYRMRRRITTKKKQKPTSSG